MVANTDPVAYPTRVGRLIGLMVLLLTLLGCAWQPVSAQQAAPLRVVATNTILADLIENVGGDRVDITALVARNGDSHTFEPAPADADAIADAALVFENGLGLEPWLDDVFEASGSGAQRVVVTDDITPLRVADELETDAHGDATPGPLEAHPSEDTGTAVADHEEGDEGHDHGEYDPHVWFDVQNVQLMVSAIENALIAADEEGAAIYQANATAYQAQLNDLDAFVLEQVGQLTEDQRKLVTSHDTFAYFAQRYGFEIVGTALGSVTTESADPSANEIAALVDEIVASGVPAIFPENTSDPGLLEQLASEAGVTVGPELFTDALGDPDGEASTYLDMVRYDVAAIVTALQG
jgi:ABC-type Zn uptake system ZnuABC Zn-binding protein ZnuA